MLPANKKYFRVWILFATKAGLHVGTSTGRHQGGDVLLRLTCYSYIHGRDGGLVLNLTRGVRVHDRDITTSNYKESKIIGANFKKSFCTLTLFISQRSLHQRISLCGLLSLG